MPPQLFSDYYRIQFRYDLHELLRNHVQPHGETHGDRVLQWYMFRPSSPPIAGWSDRRRKLFAVALYFTVLSDQVAYTYYRPHYDEWRRLTLYPKLLGGCPGGCRSNADPGLIFAMMAREDEWYGEGPVLDCSAELNEAKETMEHEVRSFFADHMPHIDAAHFWARCLQPEQFMPPQVEVQRLEQAKARQRSISRATQNLPNAVRRGDVRAVRALLAAGADWRAALPEGASLVGLAEQEGKSAVAALLRERGVE